MRPGAAVNEAVTEVVDETGKETVDKTGNEVARHPGAARSRVALAVVSVGWWLVLGLFVAGCGGLEGVRTGEDVREEIDVGAADSRRLIVLSETEAIALGVPAKTVRRIMRDFEGDATRAVDWWSVTGGFRLNRALTDGLREAGLEAHYLKNRLKRGRWVRALRLATLGALRPTDGPDPFGSPVTLNTRLEPIEHARVVIVPDSLPSYRPNSFK